MKSYEYKSIKLRFLENVEELNELGSDGWELISVTQDVTGCYHVYAHLKREIYRDPTRFGPP